MQRAMKLLGGAIVVVATGVAAPSAVAQEPGGVNGGGEASTSQEGAEVGAWQWRSDDPGELGTGTTGTSNWECHWQQGSGSGADELSGDQLQEEFDLYNPNGEGTIQVWRRCENTETGEVFEELVDWSPGTDVDYVDPAALAASARDAITLPVPHVSAEPPVASGTYAQLRTFLSVSNASDLTATATAGSNVASVTASAAEQYWTVYDGGPGGSVMWSDSCPIAEKCSWIPEHSSAGQPMSNPWTGSEPCFYAVVTVRWQMNWTFNGVAQDALDDGFVSGSICLPVAEVQAVVSNG